MNEAHQVQRMNLRHQGYSKPRLPDRLHRDPLNAIQFVRNKYPITKEMAIPNFKKPSKIKSLKGILPAYVINIAV